MTSAAHKETLQAFELKGEMSMVSVLRLLNIDTENIARLLTKKIHQAPDFFQDMPLVIDLETLSKQDELPPFPALIELLREHGFIPIGTRNGNKNQNNAARLAGLAMLRDSTAAQIQSPAPAKTELSTVAGQKEDSPSPQQTEARKSRMVIRPVRSGQQVYARNGDLVVTSSASAGSELMADGNIHVYGPLRGRALAGVQGDESTRIFCQSLEAELVAIAGHYLVSEELTPEMKNKPVQILLENGRLRITTF